MTSQLVCPKCRGAMRSYERNGVDIEQCTECRGVFLDRGELERLVDAENSFYQAGGAPSPPPRARPDHSVSHSSHPHGAGQKRRKGSFLGELFD